MLRVYMTNMGQEDHMQRLDQLNAHLQRKSTQMDEGVRRIRGWMYQKLVTQLYSKLGYCFKLELLKHKM